MKHNSREGSLKKKVDRQQRKSLENSNTFPITQQDFFIAIEICLEYCHSNVQILLRSLTEATSLFFDIFASVLFLNIMPSAEMEQLSNLMKTEFM